MKVGVPGRLAVWRGVVARTAVTLLAMIVTVVPAYAQLAEQAKLTAADGAAEDMFGGALAVDGDTLVVGVSSVAVDGDNFRGAVYVFTRADGAWTETAKLTAPDG